MTMRDVFLCGNEMIETVLFIPVGMTARGEQSASMALLACCSCPVWLRVHAGDV